MSDPSDVSQKLINQARKGDPAAVARLYERYVDQIYRYIAYRVDTQDAEDLTAEVFVRMVKSLKRYKPTGAPFEAWLYRIAAARVADYHRQKQRRPVTELPETLSDRADAPEDRVVQQQEVNALRAALRQLKPDQQEVLLLRFVEHKTHEETAALLDKSVTAVKSIQHRALKMLARQLGSEEKVRHYLRGSQRGADDA
ncbi:MAG: RNA polymerase sigma factor [Chloroflexota bacterium]